jgi:hypothetical protein
MRTDIFLAAAVLGLTNVSALFHKKGLVSSMSRTETDKVKQIKSKIKLDAQLNPQTFWFSATIDHYDSHGAGSPTY